MDELVLKHFSDYLKPRARDSHKGDFGHVLIVGGNVGYSGAVLLAAEAALRVGAGLVSVATHPDHAACLNVARPEIMCHGVSTAKECEALFQRATVLVLGPGLGRSAWSQMLFHAVMDQALPLVVDADGLNLLAEQVMQKNHWILTPHPGEAARLLQTTTQAIQADRKHAIQQLQKKFSGNIILKGSGSLVLDSAGQLTLCKQGNPGMATGGMGDVLSGVLGGLLGQKIPLAIAAQLGVLIHALAADLAAKTGERGMIASDLMPYLRQIVNSAGTAFD